MWCTWGLPHVPHVGDVVLKAQAGESDCANGDFQGPGEAVR
jgi:hypothetical protein